MSSGKLLGSWLFVVFAMSGLAVACGGDEDAGPPQIQPQLNPIEFRNFGVDTCNTVPGAVVSDLACGGGETCASCPADCGDCEDDCADGVCQGVEEFEVILTNSGGGTLEITQMEVNGDVNCALVTEPVFSDPLPIRLGEGKGTFLALRYLPGGSNHAQVGTKDQISVAIHSNSSTFPLMELSVCGCIIDHAPTEEDPGPDCECNLLEVGDQDCGG